MNTQLLVPQKKVGLGREGKDNNNRKTDKKEKERERRMEEKGSVIRQVGRGRMMCMQPYPYLVKVERLFRIDPQLKLLLAKTKS